MPKFSAALLGLTLTALVAIAAPAADGAVSPPRTLDLAYTVTSGGRDLGRIDVRIDRDGTPRRVEAITRPEGVARLFADEVKEHFVYVPVDGGWQAREYVEKGDDTIEMTFEYGDRLRARGAGDESTHPPESLVEPQGFPLSSMLLDGESLPSREILMPTNRGLRGYRYVLQGEERIEVRGKAYETVKWLKQRPDRSDRGYFIWSEKSTRVPVRIDKFKAGDVMRMEIEPQSLGDAS